MILQAAAFPVPISLLVFNKCSPTTEGMLRPKSLSMYRTNAKETFVYSSSVSSIAEEYSHQHCVTGSCWEGGMVSQRAYARSIIVF